MDYIQRQRQLILDTYKEGLTFDEYFDNYLNRQMTRDFTKEMLWKMHQAGDIQSLPIDFDHSSRRAMDKKTNQSTQPSNKPSQKGSIFWNKPSKMLWLIMGVVAFVIITIYKSC